MAPIDQVDLLTSTKVSPISSLKLLPSLEMFHYMLLNHGVTRLIGCLHHESFGVPIDDDATFLLLPRTFSRACSQLFLSLGYKGVVD